MNYSFYKLGNMVFWMITIYIWVQISVVNWNRMGDSSIGQSRAFTYSLEGYVASTISEWVSTLAGVTLYQDHSDKVNFVPSTLYFIVGNLAESPFYGYVATSTVMFGNFDIVSNYVPTLTRMYFMQSGW